MKYERLLSIFRSYVDADCNAAAETDYVYTALTSAGCADEEIEELGFGFVIPEERA